VGSVAGAPGGDPIIAQGTPTRTGRGGLIIEAAMHLVLAPTPSPAAVGGAFVAFGVHGALSTSGAPSLRQRMAPPARLGRVSSATILLVAGGNCVGAVLGAGLARAYGITAPYWVGFVVAVIVILFTWRVFDRATVAAAYASRPGDTTA